MLPTLRGHQQQNLDELRAEVKAGRHPLLVAPCGYGKGTLITYIVHSAVSLGRSVIFVVRGKSLVADMSERLRRLGIAHGILMGDRARERWHPVQVASIDTLYRMEHLPKGDLIIVDEAHMAVSPTFRKALDRYPKAVIIGATATPIRLDGKGLGRESGGLFDSLVLGPSELDLIAQEYLVRSRVLEPPPVAGAREVKMDASDSLEKQAAVFDKVKLIGDEIKSYKQYAEGRKGVTFGVHQAHAAHIAEQFTAAGIPWAYVDADTPMGDPLAPTPGTRAAIYRDLDAENGTLMGVSSVGCTAVGWDHSIVSYLGVMRMTTSLQLWRQMMGRGSRIHPGKKDFLVIDHAGNSARHAPYGYFESEIEWSLDGEAIKPGGDKKAPAVTTCKQSVMNCPCGGDHENGVHWPCYGTFKSGPGQCPFCGCPIVKKVRKIEVVVAPLVELDRKAAAIDAWRAQQDQERKKARYLELKWLAQERGYKSGYPAVRYKAEFGDWPPREWGRL